MITGSLVALVTPMHKDGALDWPSLHNLVDHHIAQSTEGIVLAGTTGEAATLTDQERYDLIKRVTDQVNGRLPVIAGTGTYSTTKTVELTAAAKDLGVAACLLVTPYYNKPTQEGLYRHYRTVADAVAIPQILYNVPARTAVDLLPETVARLAQHTHIIGIKEATGQIARATRTRALCGGDFAIYSGDDATAMAWMLQGANGVISVTSNVAPQLMQALCAAALQGDRTTAEAINQQLIALHTLLFVQANPIPVKWALHAMGLIDIGIRLPLTPLASHCQADVRQALIQANVLSC